MAQRSAPYAPQDVQEIAQLVSSLEAHNKKGKDGKKSFSCRKTTFPLPGSNGGTVDSWKMQDWDYKRDDLPTYARGLFTSRNAKGKPEILVRGYDKFFNVGEVSRTKWDDVQKHTRGPYELSLKENGCIIFISGLEDDSLLVCSKHSTGARGDTDVSHAATGEKWVDAQLAAKGKTRADLAKELRRRNATAVAELCDDSFEEHILAYGKDQAGLYLHGINLNLPGFATYPAHLLHQFAEEWGFRKTEYLMKDDIEAVRTFLEQVGETGAWNGRDVEGFVVRCQSNYEQGSAWSDWFFKYKYEEPYLLYRQWREVTKSLISGKPPRFKKHKQITEQYLQYARRQLAENPELGTAFQHNHGIIAMRDGFLREKGLKGADIIQETYHDKDGQADVTRDIVLVPVATLGCGKTTVALALCKLFKWGHVQNDNIQLKKGKSQRFAEEISAALLAHPVVIADRNNHQRRERKQIFDDVGRVMPSARFVALNYVHERAGVPRREYENKIREVTRDRVLNRGDNHQTIQAGSKPQGEIVGIMEGFLKRFEPVDQSSQPDESFDSVIDLDVTASSRENVETAVTKLHEFYPKLFGDMPAADELDGAVNDALSDYRPNIKHDLGQFKDNAKKHPSKAGPAKKEAAIEFFCVGVPATQVADALKTAFSSQPATVAQFYNRLKNARRIQPTFHVTLIHRAAASAHADIWQRYAAAHEEARAKAASDGDAAPSDMSLSKGRVQLERIVWDDRVMCVVVRLLDAEETGFNTTNQVAHITVGTASPHIKPKESNDLLTKWLVKGSKSDSGVRELGLEKKTVLHGTVKAVVQR
ncbi:MAG: hypothetical protein M1815_000590 [Lichina confinis]|nr:MAG: hypothetical protein M1815_000590 [Lichina confinis]